MKICTLDCTCPVAPAVDAPIGLGSHTHPRGLAITADSLSFFLGDKPWIPVAGEFHYSRYPREEWRDALLKMKAGGIDVVSTYVFWIHHEEEQGIFDWSGDRALREFLLLCRDAGLKAVVRLGPWCHGEARNGGFPDWVRYAGTQWGASGPAFRGVDPEFLCLVKPLYEEIAAQMTGLLWKDGGPVVGVQLDNECNGADYLLNLKRLAIEVGIDVPFYTMTGWAGVEIPQEGLLPLFGAYVEGFWPGGPDVGSFMFSRECAAATLGAQLENVPSVRNRHLHSFPFACCEIGPGMTSSYAKRVIIDPGDSTAMALVKLGSGNNMPGYYMYHGGVQPDGKRTTLQEDQPHYLPIKIYFDQTCLGAAGQARPQYDLLRQQHTFLRFFGPALARTAVYLPEECPQGREDTTTFRWSVRSDGQGSGFVFFNNRQPGRGLTDKKALQVRIHTRTGAILAPRTPIDIPSGAYGIWPLGLDCGGVRLDYATVQPLGLVSDGNGSEVFFFVALSGVRAELALHGEEPKVVVPGLSPALTVRKADGEAVCFVVLTPEQGLGFRIEPFGGGDRAILCGATVFADGDELRLQSGGAEPFEIAIFPPVAGLRAGATELSGRREGLFARYVLPSGPRPTLTVKATLEKSADPGLAPLQARDESAWAGAAVFSLQLPDTEARLILDIRYIGDVARLYVGEKLFWDDFFNGDPLSVPLWRIPRGDRTRVRLKIMPWSEALIDRLPDSAKARVAAARAAGTLDQITLSVTQQREVRLSAPHRPARPTGADRYSGAGGAHAEAARVQPPVHVVHRGATNSPL